MVAGRVIKVIRGPAADRELALVIGNGLAHTDRPEAARARPPAEIEILEREEVVLGQQPDALERGARDQHDASAHRIDVAAAVETNSVQRPAVLALVHSPRCFRERNAHFLDDVPVGRGNEHRRRDRDAANPNRGFQAAQAIRRDLGIAVDQNHQRCAAFERDANAGVGSGRESGVAPDLKHRRRRQIPSQACVRAVVRPVVHDDEILDRPDRVDERSRRGQRGDGRAIVDDHRGQARSLNNRHPALIISRMAATASGALLSRIVRLKLALASGGRPRRALVPFVEVLEVWLTHGAREVLIRARTRIGRSRIEPPPAYTPLADLGAATRALVVPLCDGTPIASIVIPVLDQPSLTHACLSAIIDHTPPGRYEVIVIDNGSKEVTRSLLDRTQGLHVVRNSTNEGFVGACNQGSRSAKGEFIVFLNNDTAVLPGWLDALTTTLMKDQRIGAVGAKLLYPDGRLQEAGSIVWRDGSGWNYGKGGDPGAAEFNFVRDVDYCSGACLMVRRKLFASLGGFDERYAPAYYEDVDLCFRVRERGYQVVYQPAAEVVHHEGATAGADISRGFKAYQRVNRTKFVERHAAALSRHSKPDPGKVRDARDRRNGRTILVVDHMVPHPDQDAGSVRMFAMLRVLVELGYRVTFVPDNLARVEPHTREMQQLGIEVMYGHAGVGFVGKHVEEFSIAVLCRAYVATKYLATIRSAKRRPYLIFDTVDVHHLREERRAVLDDNPALKRQAERTRAVELDVMRASDMVWVTSTHEADVLRGYGEQCLVEVVPGVHDVRPDVPPYAGRRDVLFIGGFRHPPNEDAVVFFVEDIWPALRPHIPAARFLVVGSDVPPRVAALACQDVVVFGHVADVAPLFDSCRVSVAPLRYGAGVKGKVIQSLAWGLPVVTTPVGAEGMGLQDRAQAMIAADPTHFAQAVLEVYQNEELWTSLSNEGRRFADAHMGYASMKARLESLMSRTAMS
jgi:GT2 family glycosyltransferase